MRNTRRVLVIGGVTVVLLVALGWLGLRLYLGSSLARSMASSRLSDAVGLPIEVEELNVGGPTSTLKFRVTEPATSTNQAPPEILRVDSATADVSLSDIITSKATPTQLTVRGVNLTLRLGADGTLLTTLPKTGKGGQKEVKIPSIKVEGATLRIQQDGRPEFVVSGADLQITHVEKGYKLAGSVKDPNWGQLELTGAFDPASHEGTVQIVTKALNTQANLLSSLPYVPASVWDHVQPAGKLPARFTVNFHKGGGIGYEGELSPDGRAVLHLPDLGGAQEATFTNVRGKILIHNERVELTNCTAQLAGGSVNVGGNLDFTTEPSVLSFQLGAKDLDVRSLPAEWGLPKQLGGKMRGQGKLELRVAANGSIEPQGGGQAVIDLTELKADEAKLKLKLSSNGKRYRFHSEASGKEQGEKSSQALPIAEPRLVGRPPVRPEEFVALISAFTVALQAPELPANANADEPTTLDATLTLRNVDIAELLKKLEVSIPYKLSGLVTTKVTVAVPVGEASTLRAYRLAGTFTSPELRVQDLPVRNVSADLKYLNGVLTLSALKGQLPNKIAPDAGRFAGQATAEIEPRGNLSASLDLDRVSLGEILNSLVGPSADVSGSVTGKGAFAAPIDKIKDPTTWTAVATVTSDDLLVSGRAIHEAAVGLKLEKGIARLADTKATIEGLPLALTAAVNLEPPYQFDATANTSPDRVADLRKLVPSLPVPFAVEGKLQTTTKVAGTLSPLAYASSGTVAADELKLGTTTGNTVHLKWEYDPKQITIGDLVAKAFGGTLTGSAHLPLDAAVAGRFDLVFKEIDSEALVKSLANFPIKLAGRVSGRFNGGLPASTDGQPRQVAGDLDLTAPKLAVQGIPAERLVGKIGFINESANYELEGKTLGGSFELKGRYPFRATKPVPKGEPGTFRLQNVNLRLAAAALKFDAPERLRGLADLVLNFNEDLSEGTGRFSFRDLTWDNKIVTEQLTGSLRLQDRFLFVNDFSGAYAGGQLRARARVFVPDPRRNFVSLTIDHADSQLLFAPVESLKEAVKGQVSIVVRGRLGGDTRGSGQFALIRGTLFGLGVNDLRIPFDWSGTGGGTGQVTVREAYTQTGQGRLTGNVTYNWGPTSRLNGKVQFYDLKLQSVLGQVGQATSIFGNGRITGRFEFSGDAIRSSSDIKGLLTANLNQTSVQELPILRTVTPYLNVTGLTSPFQAGDIRGRLGNGIFRIERLAMANPSAQLFAEGTITLATGRLDLDVVAVTGNLAGGSRGLQLFGLRIPAIGPIPVSLIRDVSDFLSNRTIRLNVGGTTSNPIVRVNAAALLTDEAVRFLVSRYILPVAGIEGIYSPGR